MYRTIHETRDKNHAHRLIAMLLLHRGDGVSAVAKMLFCARVSVERWIN
jgi:transposase